MTGFSLLSLTTLKERLPLSTASPCAECNTGGFALDIWHSSHAYEKTCKTLSESRQPHESEPFEGAAYCVPIARAIDTGAARAFVWKYAIEMLNK